MGRPDPENLINVVDITLLGLLEDVRQEVEFAEKKGLDFEFARRKYRRKWWRHEKEWDCLWRLHYYKFDNWIRYAVRDDIE